MVRFKLIQKPDIEIIQCPVINSDHILVLQSYRHAIYCNALSRISSKSSIPDKMLYVYAA